MPLVRLESDVEKAVCTYADKRGILHIKLNLWGRRGFPDRLFFIAGGKPLMIEFKRAKGKVEPMQKYIHGKLAALGYDIQVVSDTTTGFLAIDDVLRKNYPTTEE